MVRTPPSLCVALGQFLMSRDLTQAATDFPLSLRCLDADQRHDRFTLCSIPLGVEAGDMNALLLLEFLRPLVLAEPVAALATALRLRGPALQRISDDAGGGFPIECVHA